MQQPINPLTAGVVMWPHAPSGNLENLRNKTELSSKIINDPSACAHVAHHFTRLNLQSPQPAAHGLLHSDSPQTLQPIRINGNWICLMVWNIPVRG